MSDDSNSLPDNVVPFGRKEEKAEKKEVNLEEQNKAHYQKLQDDIKARRTTNNRDVTRAYIRNAPPRDKNK